MRSSLGELVSKKISLRTLLIFSLVSLPLLFSVALRDYLVEFRHQAFRSFLVSTVGEILNPLLEMARLV